MQTLEITSEAELQKFLEGNRAYANGKNDRVIHLYATAAQSRFEIENIYGIYLARPEYTWMAVWMAVTNRTKLRKRHLRYRAPRDVDRIGQLIIGGLDETPAPRDLLSDRAFLYLFDPAILPACIVDITKKPTEKERLTLLLSRGYAWQDVERHGRMRRALVPPTSETPTLLALDAWQVAIVQLPQLIPSIEVVLSGKVIHELSSRITFQKEMPGSDYLEE